MKRIFYTSVIFLAVITLIVSSYRPGPSDNPVRIEGGQISGVKSATSDVVSYKGIPFAAPPLGALRWKAPQAVIPWTGIKKCEAFGASPMQPKPVPFIVYTPEFLIPEKPISEDCLFLNVWTTFKTGAKKPVLLWIYGGGFSSGGSSVPIYDGEALAKKGIVFVSANYRVGVFGFLAHPDLTRESPNHSSGNYGLMDQIAALKWIRKNIDAFGGDPDNITIAGQSAGSMSVNCLVASPQAKGLFKKAIAESGSFLTWNIMDLKEAEQGGNQYAGSVHAGSLEALRKMPAEELIKSSARFMPITDGYLLPESVSKIFEKGNENPVPVIVGWNADESFVFGFKNNEQYQGMIRTRYGIHADEFLKYFPGKTDEEAMRSQIKMSRDSLFALSGFKWAGVQSAQKKAPVYVYYFSRKVPATPDFIRYGAFHTGEVAYAMDNLKFLHRPWEAVDHTLASQMSDYWVNFIRSSNPNGKNLPEWPSYTTQRSEAMVFDKGSSKEILPDKDELSFLLKLAAQ